MADHKACTFTPIPAADKTIPPQPRNRPGWVKNQMDLKGEGVDAAVGPDIEPVTGRRQSLEVP